MTVNDSHQASPSFRSATIIHSIERSWQLSLYCNEKALKWPISKGTGRLFKTPPWHWETSVPLACLEARNCRESCQLPFGNGKPSRSLSNEQRRKRKSYWCLKKVVLLHLPGFKVPWSQWSSMCWAQRGWTRESRSQQRLQPEPKSQTGGGIQLSLPPLLPPEVCCCSQAICSTSDLNSWGFFPLFLMHSQAVRRTGAGAAGPHGVPASRAQRGAAGSATTRPRSAEGSPARGGTCRTEPAENPRDGVGRERRGVCAGLQRPPAQSCNGRNNCQVLHFSKYGDGLDSLNKPRPIAPADWTRACYPLILTPRDVVGAPPVHSSTAVTREMVENPRGWLCCWVTMGP